MTRRAHAERACAVRARLHDVGQLGLLRARRRRAARARADAGRLPRRRRLLRARLDDVRRGRGAAPRARRLVGLRALRLQRAGQLRRRLGDPARLRDPDRRHGLHGDELPRASSGRRSATARREVVVAIGIIAVVAVANVAGVSVRQLRRQLLLAVADLGVQLLVIVLGLVAGARPERDRSTRSTSAARRRGTTSIFALTIATIAFTGLEAAASLAGETSDDDARPATTRRPGRRRDRARLRRDRGRRRQRAARSPAGRDALGDARHRGAAARRRRARFDPAWLASALRYVVALAVATLSLLAASNSRDARHLAALLRARDEPPDPQRARAPAPEARHAVRADRARGARRGGARDPGRPRLPRRHLRVRRDARVHDRAPRRSSCCATASRERERPYRIPLSVRVRRRRAAAAGGARRAAVGAGWVSVLMLHAGARYVGSAWLLGGIALYVIYRRSTATRCCGA